MLLCLVHMLLIKLMLFIVVLGAKNSQFLFLHLPHKKLGVLKNNYNNKMTKIMNKNNIQ